MEKPIIDTYKDISDNKVVIVGNTSDADQIAKSYEKMINALISSHSFINICLKNFKKEGLEESIRYSEKEIAKIEDTLRKAGVEI